MGRAARAKVEARRLMKLDAWSKGIATVVKIPEAAYEQLRAVMAAGHAAETQITALRHEITKRHGEAMVNAGLDPTRTYKIDDATNTAELVE